MRPILEIWGKVEKTHWYCLEGQEWLGKWKILYEVIWKLGTVTVELGLSEKGRRWYIPI